MKKIILSATILFAIGACNSPSPSTEAQDAQAPAAISENSQSYTIDPSTSEILWKGTKPTGDSHSGTISVKKGTLYTDKGIISGGIFSIDMNTIEVTDERMDEETKGKLKRHLTNGDFFETEKYNESLLEITSATANKITANLRIKDITKSITIPYTLSEENGIVIAKSTFSIDRTLWGVTYNSGNFFQNLGDYLIDDAIQFDLTIQGKK